MLLQYKTAKVRRSGTRQQLQTSTLTAQHPTVPRAGEADDAGMHTFPHTVPGAVNSSACVQTGDKITVFFPRKLPFV